jgi:mannitol/fructose-specific phosphotransferase system IIA component (Ntr-type)
MFIQHKNKLVNLDKIISIKVLEKSIEFLHGEDVECFFVVTFTYDSEKEAQKAYQNLLVLMNRKYVMGKV